MLRHFFAEVDAIKHWRASGNASGFGDCQGKFQMLLYDSAKTTCWAKLWFFSYGRQCAQTLRWQNFFNHQYLWKELLNNSIFLHEDNHKRKAASQTTIFGWVWPITLQVSLIISISEKISWYVSFCAYS